jgi:hypothetical protein
VSAAKAITPDQVFTTVARIHRLAAAAYPRKSIRLREQIEEATEALEQIAQVLSLVESVATSRPVDDRTAEG